MEIIKKVLEVEHPHTLANTANLALTYSSQKRLKEAEELQVQMKKVLGAEYLYADQHS